MGGGESGVMPCELTDVGKVERIFCQFFSVKNFTHMSAKS